MDIAALKTEIDTDPLTLGYAAPYAAGDDGAVARLLNEVRAGVEYEQWRGVVASHEIIDNTVPAEWASLSAAEKQRFETLTGAGQVNLSSDHVRAAFAAMFPSGSTTRANLVAMAKRQGSRAEVLWGAGTTVTHEQVRATRSS